MRLVAADARARFHRAECIRAGIADAVPVRDVRADPFHDGTDLATAWTGRLDDRLRLLERAIARAVAARQQVLQRVIGQQGRRHRRDPRRKGDVALGLHLQFGADAHAPTRHHEALAQVAEHVDELGRPDVGIEGIGFADQPLRIAAARTQHGDHRAVFDRIHRQFASGQQSHVRSVRGVVHGGSPGASRRP